LKLIDLSIIKKTANTPLSTIPAELNKPYLAILDGLRGIAILTVVMGHSAIGYELALYIKGYIGVGIFYVLSGFLITTLLLKEKIKYGTVSFKSFYIRRALRILPVAYLFLIVLILLSLVLKLNISALSFLSSAFFIRNLPLNYGPGAWSNGHFYTLAVEEQFYLIFPVLIIYCYKHYVKIVCFIIAIVPVVQYIIMQKISLFYNNDILRKLCILFVNVLGGDAISILIGTLLAVFIFNGTLLPRKKTKNYFFSTFLFCGAIIIRSSNLITDGYLTTLVFSTLIAYVIYLCLGQKDLLIQILENFLLVRVGVLSYSIYVWQQLFTKYQPWSNLFSKADSLLLNIPLLIITSVLSYYFFERKFLKLKAQFRIVEHKPISNLSPNNVSV
jgi:peptidoglycan/LPS O-acetylase OafA/YrhL